MKLPKKEHPVYAAQMSETERMDGRYGSGGAPRKKGAKKFSPPRYPFISLITAGSMFGLEGSVPFCLLFPSCSEINKPAANALVRAQCAAICLGKFVYLVLINFNNGAQPPVIKQVLRTGRLGLRRAAKTSSGPFLWGPPPAENPLGPRDFTHAWNLW